MSAAPPAPSTAPWCLGTLPAAPRHPSPLPPTHQPQSFAALHARPLPTGLVYRSTYLNPATCNETCLVGADALNSHNVYVRPATLDRTIQTALMFINGALRPNITQANITALASDSLVRGCGRGRLDRVCAFRACCVRCCRRCVFWGWGAAVLCCLLILAAPGTRPPPIHPCPAVHSLCRSFQSGRSRPTTQRTRCCAHKPSAPPTTPSSKSGCNLTPTAPRRQRPRSFGRRLCPTSPQR